MRGVQAGLRTTIVAAIVTVVPLAALAHGSDLDEPAVAAKPVLSAAPALSASPVRSPVPPETFRLFVPAVERTDNLVLSAVYRTMALEDRLLAWDWEAGVALAGLMSAYELTGDEAILDYVDDWFSARILERVTFLGSEREPPDCASRSWLSEGTWHPNHATPVWAALWLHEKRPRRELRQLAEVAVRFLQHDACRVDGAIAHVPGQVWDDTLIVSVPLLARFARRYGDEELLELAVQQVLAHSRLLQDEPTGLWYHGWRSEPGDNMSGAFWARGNGWAALATSELLMRLPEDHPSREEIRRNLMAQLGALIALQDSSGLWHTEVTRSDFYLETSGSAAIAAAIRRSVEAGWVETDDRDTFEQAALRAEGAVRGRVAPDGSVTGVSSGTGVAPTVDQYDLVPTDRTQPYGQGLFLLMSAATAVQ